MLKSKEFSFLVDKKRVFKIQKKLETIFKKNSKNNYDKIKTGHHAVSFDLWGYFLKDNGFWWGMWDDKKAKRFVNAFGVGEPNWGKTNSMNCQISLPYSKINRSTGGILTTNSKGEIYLAHSGRMGGSRKGISIEGFRRLFPKKKMWIEVSDGKKTKEYVLISKINDVNFLKNLQYFIIEFHKIKEILTKNISAPSSNKKSRLYDKVQKMQARVKTKKLTKKYQKNLSSEKNNEDSEEDEYVKDIKKFTRSDIDKMIRDYKETHLQNKKSVKCKTFYRDPYLSAIMKVKYNHTCQLCNQRTFQGKAGNFYTESHHVIPRSKKGHDMPNNILILCPTCHKIFDKGMPNVLIDTYRKMRKRHLFSDFEGLLKTKEITKSMYQKILK